MEPKFIVLSAMGLVLVTLGILAWLVNRRRK